MKLLSKKMAAGTLATALILGGSLAATVHNAYAEDSASTPAATTPSDSSSAPAATAPSDSSSAPSADSAPAAASAPTASAPTTSDPAASAPTAAPADSSVKPRQLAKQESIDLALNNLSFRTGVLMGGSSVDVDKALDGGSTLSAIASGHMSDGGDYVTELLDLPNSNIDAAANAGRITAGQADQLKTYVANKIKSEINDPDYRDAQTIKDRFGKELKVKHRLNPGKLAKFLGISVPELQTELDAGKSLGDIAQGKGFSEDQLLSELQKETTPTLKRLISRTKPQPYVAPASDSSSTVTDSTYSN